MVVIVGVVVQLGLRFAARVREIPGSNPGDPTRSLTSLLYIEAHSVNYVVHDPGWKTESDMILVDGKILTVDEVVSIVDSIQADDLLRVAQQLLIADKLNLAVVGPVEDKRLEELLQL